MTPCLREITRGQGKEANVVLVKELERFRRHAFNEEADIARVAGFLEGKNERAEVLDAIAFGNAEDDGSTDANGTESAMM